MKKYKLIKEYPGSPELGFILDDNLKCRYGTNTYILNTFPIKPEKYPENWEEVVEKDYEILDICYSNSNHKIVEFTPHMKEAYKTKNNFIQCFLNSGAGYGIYRVKRLSDGEVFTVGDSINEQREKSKILYFEIRENNELAIRISHLATKGSSTIFMWSNFQHIKQPLFTTEDNVDIYIGDIYYELALTFKPNYKTAIYKSVGKDNIFYSYDIPAKKEILNQNGRYYFSTMEAARDYSIFNMPCLSIKDFTIIMNNNK